MKRAVQSAVCGAVSIRRTAAKGGSDQIGLVAEAELPQALK